MYNFQLKIEEIVARDITERAVIRNTGKNAGDETSFTINYAPSDSEEIYVSRYPFYEEFIRIKKGEIVTDLDLLDVRLELGQNESLATTINLADSDGFNVEKFIEGIVEFGQTTFEGVSSILNSNYAAIPEAISSLVDSAVKISDAINEKSAESIGTLGLIIQNENGRPIFNWTGAEDANTFLSSEYFNTAEFWATGGGADYGIKVSAEFDQDTQLSDVSFGLLGSTKSKLILLGNNPIDGYGNYQDNVLVGNSGNNFLSGDLGNDLLNGGEGNDVLAGGVGNDSMFGGLGNDIYKVDSSSDKVTEYFNEGLDTVESSINYRLSNNLENLTLITRLPLNGYGNVLDNIIRGNEADNELYGYAGNDQIYGLGGDDILNGGFGDDVMFGGQGDDHYEVDSVQDKVIEYFSEGIDTISSSVDFTLDDNQENLILKSYTRFLDPEDIEPDRVGHFLEPRIFRLDIPLSGYGNDLDNVIYGNNARNYIDAQGGHDIVYGFGGNDYLLGNDGNDVLQGNEGDAYLDGGTGID